MLAKGAGLEPGRLVAQLGDCHLYANHIDQAKELLSRDIEGGVYPFIAIEGKGISLDGNRMPTIPKFWQVHIENYEPLPVIPAPLSVGN